KARWRRSLGRQRTREPDQSGTRGERHCHFSWRIEGRLHDLRGSDMATTLRMVLDTHRLNFRMAQWPITVLDAFEDIDAVVQKFHKDKAAIDADRHLTNEGRVAASIKSGRAALKAIHDLHTPRLAGLDADLAAHRAALVPVSTEQPDARRIDFLLSHLRDKTPLDV